MDAQQPSLFFLMCYFYCSVCNCDAEGTARDICDPNTGECICMKNFAGPRCDVCNEGYHRFPSCVGKCKANKVLTL